MRTYMIRNITDGYWFSSNRSKTRWQQRQQSGTVWTKHSDAVRVMKHNHLDASIAEIVEFDMTEIK